MPAKAGKRWWSRWLFAGALIASMGACGDDDTPPAQQGASREDVAESGEELVGRTVTVSGVVNDSYGEQALEIAGEGAFFDGASVLVVGHNLPTTAAGALVEVTGTVRRFDVTELERQLAADLPFEPGAYEFAIEASGVTLVRPSGAKTPSS